jgi:hypothetical protein
MTAASKSLFARLKPFAQLAMAALLAAIGAGVGGTALVHMVDPTHVGLWSGPHAFFFGMPDGPVRAHQLPASTLYVAALVVVVICWKVCRELVGFARAGLAGQAR